MFVVAGRNLSQSTLLYRFQSPLRLRQASVCCFVGRVHVVILNSMYCAVSGVLMCLAAALLVLQHLQARCYTVA